MGGSGWTNSKLVVEGAARSEGADHGHCRTCRNDVCRMAVAGST